jgi:hypothetical protein
VCLLVIRVYTAFPLSTIRGELQLKRAPVRYAYRIVLEKQNPESLRSALDRGRTWMVLATLGTFPCELAAWRRAFHAKSETVAARAVARLMRDRRGDWLVRLKASNPERCRAILRHKEAQRYLWLPEFAALRPSE